MASIARLLLVPTQEFEARYAVIEARLTPPSRGVTLTAGRITKGVSVRVLIAVAGLAGRLNGFIFPIWVALRAFHSFVAPLQRKPTHLIVIKSEMPSGEARLSVA